MALYIDSMVKSALCNVDVLRLKCRIWLLWMHFLYKMNDAWFGLPGLSHSRADFDGNNHV